MLSLSLPEGDMVDDDEWCLTIFSWGDENIGVGEVLEKESLRLAFLFPNGRHRGGGGGGGGGGGAMVV